MRVLFEPNGTLPPMAWPDVPLPTADALAFWNGSIGARASLASEEFSGTSDDWIAALPDGIEVARWLSAALQRPWMKIDSVGTASRRVPSSTRSLLVTGTTAAVTYAALDKLLDGDDGPPLGLIIGPSDALLRWSAFKAAMLWRGRRSDHDDANDLILCAQPEVVEDELFPDAERFWWKDLKAAALPRLARHRMLACLMSHSNGVDGNFNDLLLCPVIDAGGTLAPLNADARAASEGLPSCVTADCCQRDPAGRRTRFSASALHAAIVHYDTCAGMLFTGAFSAHDAALGTAFLRGPCAALLTTWRKKSSNIVSAALVRALLRHGCTLGAVARELNRFQRGYYGELPSFVLFGDPATRIAPPQEQSASFQRRDDGTIEIDWYGHAVPVPRELVDGAPVATGAVAAVLGNNGTAEWWLFRTAPEPKERVEFFHPEHVLEQIDVVDRRFREGTSLLGTVAAGLRGAAAPEALAALEQLARDAQALFPVLDSLRQAASSRAWWTSRRDALLRHAQLVLFEIEKLNARFPAAWRMSRQWVVLHHAYTHAFDAVGHEERHDEDCPVCGSAVTRKRTAGRLGNVRRSMYTCIRCGVVGDVPNEASVPRAKGPSHVHAGDHVQQRLLIPLDDQPAGAFAAGAYFGGFGADVVRCDITTAEPVENGGSVETTVELAFAPDCPPGLYSLVFASSSLLVPTMAAKYITVQRRSA